MPLVMASLAAAADFRGSASASEEAAFHGGSLLLLLLGTAVHGTAMQPAWCQGCHASWAVGTKRSMGRAVLDGGWAWAAAAAAGDAVAFFPAGKRKP